MEKKYPPCLLCGIKPATKTNSHIIPSFMVASVCSYDGSGKRDKEVMFTMSTYEDRIYTGAIPSTKYEELFDMNNLSDERIENELKVNTASKDYIFCPDCEKALADYLESPYGNHLRTSNKIDAHIPYFFWLSVVWRMSISGQFIFRFPDALEQHLGEKLYAYLEALKKEENVSELVKSCLFRYRIIYAPDYLKNENPAGYLGGRFDDKRLILSLSMGDKILCVTFNEDTLPEDYDFMGFGNELRAAPINNGQQDEQITTVTKERFEEGVQQMMKETALKRLFNEKDVADAMWRAIGLSGSMPGHIFEALIKRLYSEECKQGDRKTNERYVEVFNETLQSFGYKPRE